MWLNPENMVKARIAETIVEEMFRRAGFQVYRFGYESVLQNLVQDKNHIKKEGVGETVSSMPDFLVVKKNIPQFIEVKYRKSGQLGKDEFTSWSNGRILLVFPFPPYFRISRVQEFKETGRLYDLDKDRFIRIDKKIIDRFIPLVEKYLKGK